MLKSLNRHLFIFVIDFMTSVLPTKLYASRINDAISNNNKKIYDAIQIVIIIRLCHLEDNIQERVKLLFV